MTSNPKISIVIPVYNGSNYLREAITSALAQTYQNIEVIVVNDGSNDKGQTEAIARSFGDKIRYFSKENGGVSSALNLGIRHMEGEWFAWLSHDDLFSRNRCEEDVTIMNNNPDARIIFCKTGVIDEKGEMIEEILYPVKKITNPREAVFGVHMCTMTIHKTCFAKSGLFDEENRTTQDTQISLLLSKHFSFFFNDKAITYTREHEKRGIHVLSQHHKKDIVYLCDVIYDQMSIDDFFPGLKNNPDNLPEAWKWMGFLYYNWGATGYADECFHESVRYEKTILKKMIMHLKILKGIISVRCQRDSKK